MSEDWPQVGDRVRWAVRGWHVRPPGARGTVAAVREGDAVKVRWDDSTMIIGWQWAGALAPVDVVTRLGELAP